MIPIPVFYTIYHSLLFLDFKLNHNALRGRQTAAAHRALYWSGCILPVWPWSAPPWCSAALQRSPSWRPAPWRSPPSWPRAGPGPAHPGSRTWGWTGRPAAAPSASPWPSAGPGADPVPPAGGHKLLLAHNLKLYVIEDKNVRLWAVKGPNTPTRLLLFL